MTVNISIKPGLEELLTTRARSAVKSLEEFVQELLEREAASLAPVGQQMTGPEKARAFRAWAKSFPKSLPVLSLEDVSRESLYSRD